MFHDGVSVCLLYTLSTRMQSRQRQVVQASNEDLTGLRDYVKVENGHWNKKMVTLGESSKANRCPLVASRLYVGSYVSSQTRPQPGTEAHHKMVRFSCRWLAWRRRRLRGRRSSERCGAPADAAVVEHTSHLPQLREVHHDRGHVPAELCFPASGAPQQARGGDPVSRCPPPAPPLFLATVGTAVALPECVSFFQWNSRPLYRRTLLLPPRPSRRLRARRISGFGRSERPD